MSRFSSSATKTTWRSIVAASAFIGGAHIASAEQQPPPPAPPAAGAPAVRAEPAPPNGPVMTLDQPTMDFGTVEAGKKTTVEFTFVNTGTTPLKLDKKKLKSSCRCLVAILPREPIAPGAHAVIKATFTAPRAPGDASHNLIIKYVTDPATKAEASAVLSLTGVVEPRRARTPKPRYEGRGFVLS
jgi:hypothetical protein